MNSDILGWYDTYDISELRSLNLLIKVEVSKWTGCIFDTSSDAVPHGKALICCKADKSRLTYGITISICRMS